MTPLLIPIDDSHAPLLAALHKIAFAEESWSIDSFSQLLRQKTIFGFLVIDQNKTHPLGMILCQKAFDQTDILTLMIIPEMRLKGLATLLIKKVCDHLQSNEQQILCLEVDEMNEKALSLYNKLGFKQVAVRKNYYGLNENALFLSLKLNPHL
jgi:ribosomal-protein-alanine N-acetyltransferase